MLKNTLRLTVNAFIFLNFLSTISSVHALEDDSEDSFSISDSYRQKRLPEWRETSTGTLILPENHPYTEGTSSSFSPACSSSFSPFESSEEGEAPSKKQHSWDESSELVDDDDAPFLLPGVEEVRPALQHESGGAYTEALRLYTKSCMQGDQVTAADMLRILRDHKDLLVQPPYGELPLHMRDLPLP